MKWKMGWWLDEKTDFGLKKLNGTRKSAWFCFDFINEKTGGYPYGKN